ncbi:MAG: hypothetical protein HUU20_16210 [Pirellulales bacterium]|nr:hypothetical protein [Pirellulales bacterium]
MESLEDRALLSASAGLAGALPMSNTVPAVYGMAMPGTAAAAAAASQLELHAPENVPLGKPVAVWLTAEDAQGHVVRNYTGPVTVASSDPSAALPTNVRFYNGRAVFQVTFNTLGAGTTLTVTDNANATLTGTATINVVDPNVVTQFAILAPHKASTGTPVTVRVVALNGLNYPVSSYNGTAVVESSETGAVPASVTFVNGVAKFQATFNTADPDATVTVTDGSVSKMVTINVVDPSAVTQFALLAPRNAPTGTPVTVRVVALNGENRPALSYNGTADVSTNPQGATLPANVTFVNGVATFQVTFNTANANTTLTVTDSVNTSLTKTATINVVDPSVVTRFALLLPPYVPKGAPVTVRVAALNGLGGLVSNYSGPATVTSSDGAAVLPAGNTVTFTNGIAAFQVTWNTLGSQTLTVADSPTNPTVTATGTTLVRNFGRFR